MTTLGERVAQLRYARGWSVQQLANALGANHKTVQRYEEDIMQPRLKRAAALAAALGVTLSELFRDVVV